MTITLAGLCAATAVPAQAVATTYRAGYVLTGNHNGSARLALSRKASLNVAIRRPTVPDGYTGFEITSASRPTFAYFAVVLDDGNVMSGQEDGNTGSASGSLTFGTSGPPDTIAVGHVTLAPGSYTLTLVARGPSTVTLTPSTPPARTVHLVADGTTAASATTAAYAGAGPASYEYRTLAARVPPHAHFVLALDAARWDGTSTLAYLNACLGGAGADPACAVSPFVVDAVQPTVDPGSHAELSEYVWGQPPSGPTDVAFYTAVSGTVTDQYFLAIALP